MYSLFFLLNLILTFVQHLYSFYMEIFDLYILGCGSALPTSLHFPTSQVLNVRDKLFMIDCGEGCQLQFRKAKLKFSRLNAIFISHFHGDHFFGLFGLVSSLGLLGRVADLHIYMPKGFEGDLKRSIDFFCSGLPFEIVYHTFQTLLPEIIYEDRSLTVETIPLRHRMPCCGFLFREKQGQRHILRDMCDAYNVPVSMYCRLKNGESFVTDDGEFVDNSKLTSAPEKARSYAYCSDTIYLPELKSQLFGVDLLFHEATFSKSEIKRAKETYHTTAEEAALLARDSDVKSLMIGHYSARYTDCNLLLSEAKNIFTNTILSYEGLVYKI